MNMRSVSSFRARMFHVKRRWRGVLLLALAALALATPGCVNTGTNPVSGNERVYGYTWEEERKLGAQSDEQIQAQYGVYENDQLQQYVDRVGQDVLEKSALRQPDTPDKFKTPFKFTLLDSPVVNAFALPGGYVYVTRGLMSHLNNEAQLAVVLGHEITHVAARHSSAQAGKQQLGQIALLGAALGGQAAGLPGGQIAQLGGQAAQLLFLKYSRDNEEESDARGTEWASKAGYDASEGAGFFRVLQRMQQQSGQTLPTWASTHPDPGNREQRIRQLAQQYSDGATRVAQDAYYDTIDDLVVGNNPRNGYAEGGTFYHPDLAFQFPVPNGFSVQNTPQQVVMVEQNQRAQMAFTFAEGSSPQQAAQQLAQQYDQQRGVRILDDGSASSNGLSAYFVLAEGQTQQGQAVRILSYFVEYDGQVYVFQGAAPAQVFSDYQNAFQRTMRGFAPLRDQSRLDVQAAHLSIEQASRNGSFQGFLQGGSDIADLSERDLAIMNQVELNEQIQSGRPLKLLRR